MLTTILPICFGIAAVWAFLATVMLFRNPLPFPDKGHRVYGVPDAVARQVVVHVLEETSGLRKRFSFRAGPTNQTLMWDGFTVINNLDNTNPLFRGLSGNGLSRAVKNPQHSAKRAAALLKSSGYTAKVDEILDQNTPSNCLVVVTSNAFNDWVLVFRRPIIKMPKPQFID